MSAHLAIDLGAESGRAIVGALDSSQGGVQRVVLSEVHRFANCPCRLPSGWHWDVTGLWSNVLESLRSALSYARQNDLELRSLGVDTWGVDYGLVGHSGHLLALPFGYRDKRNEAAFAHTLERLGREALYGVTGIQFMPFNTLFQLVAHREAEPGLLERTARLLFMPDLIHYFLTGVTSVEATIASTSQMLDARTGDWARDLMARAGLPVGMLGEITPAGTPIGPLAPHVADLVGVDSDGGGITGAASGFRVIAPASHDTASAVAAVPADPATSWCYLSSGTWSLLGAELDAPCLTREAQRVPFTNEGGVGGTIRFLKNITGLWLVQECRRALARRGEERSYAELTEMAAGARPLRTLIDPADPDFLAPGDMPARIAAFARRTDQPEPGDTGELVRCCLESLALTYRHTLVQLEDVLGRRFDVIHIVGGGGKNRLLDQMAASATGRRVLVGPHEATAVGNALTQGLGAGTVRDCDHIRRIVRATFEPEPFEPRDTRAWDRAYGIYQNIVGRNR